MQLRLVRYRVACQTRHGSFAQHFHQRCLRFHPNRMSSAPVFSVAVWPLGNAQVELRRTFNRFHHCKQRNFRRSSSQLEPTAHSALRCHQPRLHQLLQNFGYKTFWCINRARQSRPMNPFRNGNRGQINRHSHGIVGGSRDLHTSNSGPIGPYLSDLQRISRCSSLLSCL